jgi:hypothetical protein
VEQEDPALSPGQINPGLAPGMSDSPRNRQSSGAVRH